MLADRARPKAVPITVLQPADRCREARGPNLLAREIDLAGGMRGLLPATTRRGGRRRAHTLSPMQSHHGSMRDAPRRHIAGKPGDYRGNRDDTAERCGI